MGSFDVACGISNVAIGYSDPAGIVLLNDVKHHLDDFGLFYNDPTSEFKPYLPPVFGTYDDYGRLTDIVPSPTTELLEKVFNLPATDALACTGNYGRNIHSKYGPIAEYYKNTIPQSTPQWGESWSAYLKALGFQVDNENRYTFGEYTLTREEYYFRVRNNTQQTEQIITLKYYSPEELLSEFVRITHLVPGYLPEDFSRIIKLSNLHGMFVHQEIHDSLISQQDEPRFTREELNQYFLQYADPFSLGIGSPNPAIDWFIQDFGFNDYRELGDIDIANDCMKLEKLTQLLKQVNRSYHPTVCGTQHGDDEALLRLNTVTNALLEKRISEYE